LTALADQAAAGFSAAGTPARQIPIFPTSLPAQQSRAKARFPQPSGFRTAAARLFWSAGFCVLFPSFLAAANSDSRHVGASGGAGNVVADPRSKITPTAPSHLYPYCNVYLL